MSDTALPLPGGISPLAIFSTITLACPMPGRTMMNSPFVPAINAGYVAKFNMPLLLFTWQPPHLPTNNGAIWRTKLTGAFGSIGAPGAGGGGAVPVGMANGMPGLGFGLATVATTGGT